MEVERRYRLDANSLAKTTAMLRAGDFNVEAVISQSDTYYTSKHKDFIESEECLRLRVERARTTLTWKPPSDNDMKRSSDFWKEEVDMDVTGQEPAVRRLLEALDFVEYVTVEKTREVYRSVDGLEVSIDTISGLGNFIEIEIKSSALEEAQGRIEAFASRLQLPAGAISKVPYRDLVKHANGH